MRSLILRTAARLLLPLLLLFSVFLLIRGHNEPGGGFAAGLVASAAFALHAFAEGLPQTRRMIRVDPISLLGAGLLVTAAGGVAGVLAGQPFLTGQWVSLAPVGLGHVDIGTPVVFDVGVYLVVVGAVLTIIFTIMEEA
ncbi:MAG: Na+/H+ antiporter subunit B [Armatimonadetes bacterium]|nr:Na+/H+ antiporter subunit B [Armatimonadota bacterium]